MALLTRYFQLGDADGTEVLNFIVTKAVTRDLKRDVISKDFVFGFHRWALSFSREEKVRERRLKVRKSERGRFPGLTDFHFSVFSLFLFFLSSLAARGLMDLQSEGFLNIHGRRRYTIHSFQFVFVCKRYGN